MEKCLPEVLINQNPSVERNDAPPNRRMILERYELRRLGLGYHSRVARQLLTPQRRPRPLTTGAGLGRKVFVSLNLSFSITQPAPALTRVLLLAPYPFIFSNVALI